MDKLEKVILGLEYCLATKTPGQKDNYCDNCPYNCDGLKQDALELLKAYKPCLMTLEEVCKAIEKNAILFTECEKENMFITSGMAHFSDLAIFNDSKYDNCKITFIRHTHDGTQKYEWYVFLKNYGKTWRCWTSQPTEEQKKAVKWK